MITRQRLAAARTPKSRRNPVADLKTSIHFRSRLATRCGISLTDDEYQDLCARLTLPGQYRVLRAGRNLRLIISFRLGGQQIRAVWSPYTRQLITAFKSHKPQED